MNLFNQEINTNHNLLPYGGTVNYYGPMVNSLVADQYFNALLHKIDWKNDEAIIMGKHIITKRKVAWYGDRPYAYTYSKTSKSALPWTNELLKLKQIVEDKTEKTYNSCLLNLYHNGEEGMAYHSDNETALEKHGSIASLSFGAERKFLFKHKQTKETVSIYLEHGSLLVMKDQTQDNWLHRLPPTTKVTRPRINLTFRTIIEK